MDKDREDVDVRSHGDAWPVVSNPSNYDVLKDGEKDGEVVGWDREQATEKAKDGDYRRTR